MINYPSLLMNMIKVMFDLIHITYINGYRGNARC